MKTIGEAWDKAKTQISQQQASSTVTITNDQARSIGQSIQILTAASVANNSITVETGQLTHNILGGREGATLSRGSINRVPRSLDIL